VERLILSPVGESNETQAQYAGFVIRAGARLTDVVFLYVVGFVAAIVTVFLLAIGEAITGNQLVARLSQAGVLSWWNVVLGMLSVCGYHTICEGFHGSTLGKLVFGLVTLNEDLTPCKLKGATIRNLVFIFLDGLAACIPALLVMNRSPEKQRIGDQWGKTVVVRRSSVPSTSRRPGWRFVPAFVGASAFSFVIALMNLMRATLGGTP